MFSLRRVQPARLDRGIGLGHAKAELAGLAFRIVSLRFSTLKSVERAVSGRAPRVAAELAGICCVLAI